MNIIIKKHFLLYKGYKLKKAAEQFNLEDLSMGMSSDYEQAIVSGSTYLRLGTAIMGERKSN